MMKMSKNARKAYQAFAKYKLDNLYTDEMSNKDIVETLTAIRDEIIQEIDNYDDEEDDIQGCLRESLGNNWW